MTNRMEETIGECTNLHITYPALVLGYLVLLRANRIVEAVAGRNGFYVVGDPHDPEGAPNTRKRKRAGK